MELPQQIQHNKLLLGAFAASLLVILILVAIIIFRPDHKCPPVVDTKGLRDTIILFKGQVEQEKAYTLIYKNRADSFMAVPPKLHIIYYEKKQFIARATINQLDSIVRSTAHLPVRATYPR